MLHSPRHCSSTAHSASPSFGLGPASGCRLNFSCIYIVMASGKQTHIGQGEPIPSNPFICIEQHNRIGTRDDSTATATETARRCLFIVANRLLPLCCCAAVCTPRRLHGHTASSGGVQQSTLALPCVRSLALPLAFLDMNVDVD